MPATRRSSARAARSGRCGRIANGLAGVTGRRKADPLLQRGGAGDAARSLDLVTEFDAVTAAAARANVTIYAFDPRGLDLHMGAELLATGVSPSTQLQQGRRLAAEMLRSLAESTGGIGGCRQQRRSARRWRGSPARAATTT